MSENERNIELRALVVDKKPALSKELKRALLPEIEFLFIDFANSVRRAILSQSDESYNVCFISDVFTDEEVEMFFADIVKLGRQNACLFVKVVGELDPDFDRASLREKGFTTVITNKGTHNDKESLNEVFQEFLAESEVERKVRNVDDVMSLLVREIDKVAKDRKRGIDRKFNTISIDYIAEETTFHEDVLMEYFTALGNKTQQTPEKLYNRLAVPENVVSRDLPNLKDGTYTGVSQRVWDKLTAKYGVEEEDVASLDCTDESHEVDVAPPESSEDAVWEKLKSKYEVS